MQHVLRAAVACAVVVGLAPMSYGVVTSVSDDLTDGSIDPFFAYDFSGDFNNDGNPDFNLLDSSGLLLASDLARITFPGLPAGAWVVEVGVTFIDYTGVGATEFEAFDGLGNSFSRFNATSSFDETLAIGETDLGNPIAYVDFSGFETALLDITVRYDIPAPGAAVGLAPLGLLALRRRR